MLIIVFIKYFCYVISKGFEAHDTLKHISILTIMMAPKCIRGGGGGNPPLVMAVFIITIIIPDVHLRENHIHKVSVYFPKKLV